MPRRRKAKVVKYAGYRVRLKKGATKLTTAQKNKIHMLESESMARGRRSLSTSDACIIYFPRGSRLPVQRCEGRHAKAKWARLAKARNQCRRGGRGWRTKVKQQKRAGRRPTAHLYTPC